MLRFPMRIYMATGRSEIEVARDLIFSQFSTATTKFSKHHILPSTYFFIAKEADQLPMSLGGEKKDGRVVGAICMYGPSQWGLPLKALFPTSRVGNDEREREAEISLLGLTDPDHLKIIAPSLYRYILEFSMDHCHFDALYLVASKELVAPLQKYLPLEMFSSSEGSDQHLWRINLRALQSTRNYSFCAGGNVLKFASEPVHFTFPNRVVHSIPMHMYSPADMKHFFVDENPILEQLTDEEFRYLTTFYGFEEYHDVFPERLRNLKFARDIKYKRFLTHCKGTMAFEDGLFVEFTAENISRGGMKFTTNDAVSAGDHCVVRLQVSLEHRAEFWAKIVWFRKDRSQGGLEITAADDNWERVIDFLEGTKKKSEAA